MAEFIEINNLTEEALNCLMKLKPGESRPHLMQILGISIIDDEINLQQSIILDLLWESFFFCQNSSFSIAGSKKIIEIIHCLLLNIPKCDNCQIILLFKEQCDILLKEYLSINQVILVTKFVNESILRAYKLFKRVLTREREHTYSDRCLSIKAPPQVAPFHLRQDYNEWCKQENLKSLETEEKHNYEYLEDVKNRQRLATDILTKDLISLYKQKACKDKFVCSIGEKEQSMEKLIMDLVQIQFTSSENIIQIDIKQHNDCINYFWQKNVLLKENLGFISKATKEEVSEAKESPQVKKKITKQKTTKKT